MKISPILQDAQYARGLIEASLDPLIAIGNNGKVSDVNEATARVTGVSRKRSLALIWQTTLRNQKKPILPI